KVTGCSRYLNVLLAAGDTSVGAPMVTPVRASVIADSPTVVPTISLRSGVDVGAVGGVFSHAEAMTSTPSDSNRVFSFMCSYQLFCRCTRFTRAKNAYGEPRQKLGDLPRLCGPTEYET